MKKKIQQINIQCLECGKWQYVRLDSECADQQLCSKCAADAKLLAKAEQVAKKEEPKPAEVTHCTCGAMTTHKCTEYDCAKCMGTK